MEHRADEFERRGRRTIANLEEITRRFEQAEQGGSLACLALMAELGGHDAFLKYVGQLAILERQIVALVPTRQYRLKQAPGSFTKEEIIVLLDRQEGRCAYARKGGQKPDHCLGRITKRTCHRDHITPIARNGSNDISNIQLTCRPCNLRKHAADPIDHARKNGLLL